MHLYVNTYDTFIIILPRVYTSIPGEIVQVSLEEGSDAVFSKQRHENFFSPPLPIYGQTLLSTFQNLNY